MMTICSLQEVHIYLFLKKSDKTLLNDDVIHIQVSLGYNICITWVLHCMTWVLHIYAMGITYEYHGYYIFMPQVLHVNDMDITYV